MAVETKKKNLEDIRGEYNQIFRTEPIRDDDRGYAWLAGQIFKARPKLKSLLDVACGGGYFLKHVRQQARGPLALVGTDLSDAALEIAKKECPEASYHRVSAEEMSFPEASFDAVTCLGSLEHFLNLETSLRAMRRVAKPDALIFILVPNMFWYKDVFSVMFSGHRKVRNQTHERFACVGEWEELLTETGLRVQRVMKYNGVARYGWKQALKDLLIPLRFSYHFLFICSP